MIWNFLEALFGERSTVTSECQVHNTAPNTIIKEGMLDKNDEKALSDIELIEKHYGELFEGKVVETTLHHIQVFNISRTNP